MMATTSFLLALAGGLFLALAMHRHARGPAHLHRPTLRVAGGITLFLSAAITVADIGWGPGLILWVGLLTPAFGLAVLLLSYRPGMAARTAFSCFFAGLGAHAVILTLS